MSHEGPEHRDWTGEVDSWIRALIQARGARTAPTARTGAVAAGVAGATAAGAVGGGSRLDSATR
ncbi:hypothetical protein [Streptomyces malaysiensis]|uniref:hypothetical protein n=1 Tax=Streptomyces malaysiensis TaxID=92644 RepID=UPI002B2C4DC1|nr:hypothetical protein R8789_30505 [Streptomyces malaysiensis]